MFYLNRREKLKSEYIVWSKRALDQLNIVEENIFQSDSKDKVLEKVFSISLSGGMVFLAAPLFAIVGLTTAGVGAVVIFIIGWLLSRVINKKAFGNERTEEELQQVEVDLLSTKNELYKKIKSRQMRINLKNTTKRELIFSNALEQIEMLDKLERKLSSYDSSHLSLKYQERQKKARLSWIAGMKNLKNILGVR